MIFLQEETHQFHINNTRIIKTVKQNKLSVSSIEINQPLPTPIWCLVSQIQVQNLALVVATNQMPNRTYSRINTGIQS